MADLFWFVVIVFLGLLGTVALIYGLGVVMWVINWIAHVLAPRKYGKPDFNEPAGPDGGKDRPWDGWM